MREEGGSDWPAGRLIKHLAKAISSRRDFFAPLRRLVPPDFSADPRSQIVRSLRPGAVREWRKKEVGVSTRVAVRDVECDVAILCS